MVSSRDRTLEFRQALTSLNPKFQGKVNSSGDSTASIKLLNASSKVVGMMTCVRNQIKENRQRYLDVSDLDERSKGLEWRRELEDMIREFSVQTEMSIDTLRESLDQSKQTILQSNRDLAMFYSGVIAYLYEMLKSVTQSSSLALLVLLR